MAALLGWRVYAAIGIVVLLAGTHWRAYTRGQKDVQADWTAEKLQVAEQTARVLQDAARKTAELQTQSDTLRKVKNAQITALNADLSDALERLRDRPERPGAGSVPSDAAAGPAPGCTSAQLYREDAGALVRLAADADRLRADLGECQAAYNTARDALK